MRSVEIPVREEIAVGFRIRNMGRKQDSVWKEKMKYKCLMGGKHLESSNAERDAWVIVVAKRSIATLGRIYKGIISSSRVIVALYAYFWCDCTGIESSFLGS